MMATCDLCHMTDQEHAALSAQLAKALGYYPESVNIVDGKCFVFRVSSIMQEAGITPTVNFWHFFDYKSPNVYGPLIEWLGEQSPMWIGKHGREWKPWAISFHGRAEHQYADTLSEAVARAVIAIRSQK